MENAVLQSAAREKLPKITLDNPMFKYLCPITQDDADQVLWDQDDDIKGLMTPRIANAEFATVQRVGTKQMRMDPSKFGEKIVMTEDLMTRSRKNGEWGTIIDLSYQQAKDQDQLLTRAIDRIMNVAAKFHTDGEYYININGSMVLAQKFTIQTFTSPIPLTTYATATPIADLRALKAQYGRISSAKFGSSAVILMNSVSLNALFANQNPGDLYGRYVSGRAVAQPMNPSNLDAIMLQEDLPRIVEWDDAYFDENGVAQPHLPDGKAIVIGNRPDAATPSEFVFTANMNNIQSPGAQSDAELRLSDIYYNFELDRDPILGKSSMGFNGGLAPKHPRAFVSWTMWS